MRGTLGWLLFMVWALAMGLGAKPSWADPVHGVMQIVKGDVSVLSPRNGGKPMKARVGDKVYPKDVIVTGPDSRAKIIMTDQNVLNISPDSKLEISRYVFEGANSKKEVLLDVIYGKVRSKVEQKYDGAQNKFEVKTPTAVAGVRGTDFLASFDPTTRTTQVITFSGEVTFGNLGPNGTILNPTAITPGNMASLTGETPPEPPKPLPPAQLSHLEAESRPDAPSARPTTPASQDRSTPNGPPGGRTPAEGERQPSSLTPPRSMILPEDLGRGPEGPTHLDNRGPQIELPPPPSLQGQPIFCEFCTRIIESGNTQLRLIIRNQ